MQPVQEWDLVRGSDDVVEYTTRYVLATLHMGLILLKGTNGTPIIEVRSLAMFATSPCFSQKTMVRIHPSYAFWALRGNGLR
jgi:hypothetical protein